MTRSTEALVSIIVPVFNVKKYIDECLKSVTEQTYNNIEIILVDDASPDGSGEKCDRWAKRDSRIKVIHKPKNEGLNMARKTGFEAAKGQFITFLDSDDLFNNRNIEVALEALLNANADIAAYADIEFYDGKKVVVHRNKNRARTVLLDSKEEIARYALFGEGTRNDHFMTVWGKLYKRNVINNVNWATSNYRLYEDMFWTPQAILSAKRVALSTQKLLYYRRYTLHNKGASLSGQLVGNMKNGKLVGYLEQVEQRTKADIALAKKHGLPHLEERIRTRDSWKMSRRIDKLIQSDLLGSENNMKFFPKIWQWHIQTIYNIEHDNKVLRDQLEQLTKPKFGLPMIKRKLR